MALQTHFAIVHANGHVQIKKFQNHHIEAIEGFGWCEFHNVEPYDSQAYTYMEAQAIMSKYNKWRTQGEFYRLCTDSELKDAAQ